MAKISCVQYDLVLNSPISRTTYYKFTSEFSSGVNMDKFVIRKKREDAVEKSSEKTEKVLKQATIDSLKVFYEII